MVSSFRPRLWPGDLLALKNILRGFGDFFVLGGGVHMWGHAKIGFEGWEIEREKIELYIRALLFSQFTVQEHRVSKI